MIAKQVVLSPWAGILDSIRPLGLPAFSTKKILSFVRGSFCASRKRVSRTNPYKTLGVSRFASTKTIKSHYRNLVRAHHPDICGKATTRKLAEVNAAYDAVLRRRGLKRNMTRL